MKMIEKLSDMIEEEIDDAEKYAQCALNHKEDNKELAEVFYTLSGEELKHMEMLHGQVVKMIEAHKKEKGEPPIEMKFLYDYLHKKHIEKVAEINVMRTMYKG